MAVFLSCDWGTSSFRLRLVQTEGLLILAEEVTNDGIAVVFKNWMEEKADESDRLFFYQSYLHGQIKKIEAAIGYQLHGLPLLLSGMASSSIGMLELRYKELPFRIDGSNLHTHLIEPSLHFPYRLILVSGATTGDDVMRGEETLLVGCAEKEEGESVYIFPGTHSKHVRVENGLVQHFETYMTGEFFELLATKSILSNSVETDETQETEAVNPYFEKGILEGSSLSLLHCAFHVRTAGLFKKHTPKENYHYLSGLLIGTELKELLRHQSAAIFLVSGNALATKYEQGLRLLGLNGNLQTLPADRALIRGHLHIYEALKRLQEYNK